ncbi:MAG: hypothetical protein CMO55_14975 [Verrucomicrobiales bacterium]|nr:hypothetical protein [Verrucomicrobiales bacterium]
MMESLNTWWDHLNLVTKFFYGIGILSTVILCVQTILSLIGLDGGDSDGALDTVEDVDGGEGSDVGFLSFRTIVAFLTGFGWIGALLLKIGTAIWIALLAAGATGFVFMFLIFWLMRALWSMRESGTLDYRSAIGEIGSVYLPIPGERTGKGQIEVMMQGRLQTVPAVTSKPDRLENRSRVLVVDVLEDNTLVVVPDDTPTQP